jgi:hypothetical protein
MLKREKERWLGAVKAIKEEADLVERLLTDPPGRMNAPQLANELRISGGVIRNLAVELTLSPLDRNGGRD